MRLPILILPAARRDMDRQADFLGRDNLALGRRFLKAAEKTIKRLAERPEIGARCEFDSPRLRQLRNWPIQGFENHLIFYVAANGTLTVVRVLHGAMDLETAIQDLG